MEVAALHPFTVCSTGLEDESSRVARVEETSEIAWVDGFAL